tara:strand:- start:1781 stop:2722 length:942 start_codon:yes stop_codon:yes gene_type:complete
MKHPKKLTLLLITLFFVTQIIGLFVISAYAPITTQITNEQGELVNKTSYNLPYGTEPPSDIDPKSTVISIVIALVLAITIIFILMKFNAAVLLKIWLFAVMTLAMGITFNAFLQDLKYASLLALAIAIPLAVFKVFKRNLLVHNITELLIYPGIAVIFVPLLSIWTTILLLILISLYDMWAVWHSGLMQKMANFQIEKLQIFTGLFIPYLSKGQKSKVKDLKKQRKAGKSIKGKAKSMRVNVAILGGGDIVFPIILAGVVLQTLGIIQALIISIGATIALAALFKYSEKGKFYPAMPFISTGCLIALGIAYLI